MIFDYSYHDMNHMLGWGLNGLIYIVLGSIFLVLITLIFLYILSRTTNKETYKTGEKIIQEDKDSESVHFCPNCGAKLDSSIQKYCLFCGTKI